MDRAKFIIATAIILFITYLMGWFSHWLIHRFTRVSRGEMGEVDRMAQQLHEAEEARDQAVAYFQQREAEMTNQANQSEAELRAAMEGLREARHEAEELRAYIERVNSQ
ncbi:hypothetical protein AQS8620_00575 [Aquimixticola soesokkakensis]|uniref:Membrane-bound metallopeptidase n=1 Tax=Aquimixticola soesokkakensis TaxID=1519096 RepID=A0A1Y5RPC7_9RHOB|nr:hypothetical protein [Aquimixticola soesokkakensis]SLN21064.1 hypothetical protein AQS8620_00575 [Aquimixticola soesokkakensis]